VIFWITGASGKIGRVVADRIVSQGHSVVGIGRSTAPSNFHGSWVTWDPTVQMKVPVVLPAPDCVIHLAAQTSALVAASDVPQDVQANVLSMTRLISAAAASGTRPHIITAGSITEKPLDTLGLSMRDSVTATSSFYETAKAAQRLYLAQFARDGIIDFTTLRLPNVYGGGRSSVADRGFLDRCIAQACQHQPVAYFASRPYSRDYLHVEDAAGAFMAAALRHPRTRNRTYDIGTGVATPIAHALEILQDVAKRLLGYQVELVPINPPESVLEVDHGDRQVDSSDFTLDSGWSPSIDLGTGMELAIKQSLQRYCDE
jgi:UDP-glucose 4-epimerase